MAERFFSENRRHVEQSERGFAESILGNTYTARIYSKHGNLARGTVTIKHKGVMNVHSAYAVTVNNAPDGSFSGTAVGVLIDRSTGGICVVLAEDINRTWYQYEIAEAIEYFSGDSDYKIYCLREKSCGAVVFTDNGGTRKYLVIRMNLGHCGLPKGHIEKYESEEQTAKREVREETGVEITLVEGFRMAVEYSLTTKTKKESVYFLGRFCGDSVKIQEAEVSSYRLCPYEDARRLITYENDRAILDAAEKLLSTL